MDALQIIKARLSRRAVILGIGNTLRSDDAVGSLLAGRIKDKIPYPVYDAGVSPENYLGKIVKDLPDNIIIIDAADFGGKPGEFKVIEGRKLQTVNLFSTHNASLSMVINYLRGNLKADIIILIIQPKSMAFGDKLSREVEGALNKLENWFYERGKEIK